MTQTSPKTSKRLVFKDAAPAARSALLALEGHVRQSGLSHQLVDLIYLRVSQLNGCSYCVDMHSRELRAAGETSARLDHLVIWHESPLFTDRERAALGWAEAVTKLGEAHVPDRDYEAVKAQFSDAEIGELTVAIGCINLWNRVGIAFRLVPPTRAAQ